MNSMKELIGKLLEIYGQATAGLPSFNLTHEAEVPVCLIEQIEKPVR